MSEKHKGEISWPKGLVTKPAICSCSNRELSQEEVTVNYHSNERCSPSWWYTDLEAKCRECGAKFHEPGPIFEGRVVAIIR